MKKLIPFLTLAAVAANAQAQTKTDFSKTASGLEYKIVKDAPGTRKPVVGDLVEAHVTIKVDTTILLDSRKQNNNQAMSFPVNQPAYQGDIVEGIMLMTAGDSAVFMLPVDTLKKAGIPDQPWMRLGANQKMEYRVSLVSVKSMAEAEKAQAGIDDALLQDYFKKNNIKATKTASGLYYVITKKGTGENAKAGQNVSVNYTGKLLDGTKFDSNVDSAFGHVQAFEFPLGQGRVIKGWDEGIALLNKGAKGTLYIPSALAYGPRQQGPVIKPNSVLVFDVELVDAK